jgi:hypothetical protein
MSSSMQLGSLNIAVFPQLFTHSCSALQEGSMVDASFLHSVLTTDMNVRQAVHSLPLALCVAWMILGVLPSLDASMNAWMNMLIPVCARLIRVARFLVASNLFVTADRFLVCLRKFVRAEYNSELCRT